MSHQVIRLPTKGRLAGQHTSHWCMMEAGGGKTVLKDDALSALDSDEQLYP